ncbi:DUF7289 family protein [Methanosarcina sp. Mfa9]|uniref:DUF7289 family protein n=1 Tax=Methanosarcina sp. Mfa9 TaxID=3439063 RepID=UPI003F831110
MKNRGFKTISSFCRSESGVSTAVAAALLIGVLVAFMTTVQINYMPVWKEDAEYAHMSDVWQDMSRLKSNIDILTAGLVINEDARIAMNSPIGVGGSEIPFIRSTTTGGTLAINNDMSGISAKMEHNGSTFTTGTSLYYTGTVSYRPSNLHYVEETYCYENGALIVSQGDRSVMKLAPGIVLERAPGSVNFLVRAVTLEGERGVMSSNTVEDIRLTTQYFNNIYPPGVEGFTNITSANLTIYTENKEAWEEYFENSAEEINLQSTDYGLSNSTYTVTFSLHPQDEELYIDIDEAVIKIEAGIQ